MAGISWQLLTLFQSFLLGTGVLPGTVWGVPGSEGLKLSARACTLARCAHGRAPWHGLERASLWKSEAIEARACDSAWAGACAPLAFGLFRLVLGTAVLLSTG
ncbi:hypothetical protein JCGZ_10895 [Jatropha curcas]|uniref:Uncharacterized protein n=1 Tax=Jatropha curcas TaxID=180498 RepID=A0A067KQZ0_JATCU|nr:hypothetical protein JCGZ_10895 [Jatropha curcas]